jgi:putative glutathione S-transferase
VRHTYRHGVHSARAPQFAPEIDARGAFVRQQNAFRNRITADGSSGYKAESGRYHLYVSWACPWAHRSIIVRKLEGLEDVVGLTVVDPIRDQRGWAFRPDPDPVSGFHFLSEAYLATDPSYQGRYTVPALWDRETNRLVSNDYHTLSTDLATQFGGDGPDLYPERLRAEIDAINSDIFQYVNNGVYCAGFATSQEAYEDAFDGLFGMLDRLEQRLAHRRYLVGKRLTEADIRLFTTLVRFDAVYYLHFKCNLRRLVDYPNLWAYARDLYQMPGFGETVNWDHIKRHYYLTHDKINPNHIVPKGPATDWLAPHGRD